MTSRWSLAPGEQDPIRHGLGFLFSGTLAFLIDASILQLLTAVFDIHPVLARVVAISGAMIVAWLSHRRLTFRLTAPPSFPEFIRYAAVGWGAAAINYAIFAAIMLARPVTAPFFALVVSSLIAMVFSYLGMRFGAFRQHGRTL
jgi:putative flippase GtrA